MEAIIIAIIVGLFGSGGYVTWYKAKNDYKDKARNSELDADSRFFTRYDKEILGLNTEIDELEDYNNRLVNELIRNGIPVPPKQLPKDIQ